MVVQRRPNRSPVAGWRGADPSLPSLADAAGSSALYGLDELLADASERLGEEITPRTVRLYATEGLIDRPGKDGRRAVYGQRHLLQLLLIRSLARRDLSLTAIATLSGYSDGSFQPSSDEDDAGEKIALGISIGDRLTLLHEPTDSWDANAFKVLEKVLRIGCITWDFDRTSGTDKLRLVVKCRNCSPPATTLASAATSTTPVSTAATFPGLQRSRKPEAGTGLSAVMRIVLSRSSQLCSEKQPS